MKNMRLNKVEMANIYGGTPEAEFYIDDEKYYLSDAQLKSLQNSTYNSTATSVVELGGVMKTICARDYKGPKCVRLSEHQGEEV